MSKKDFIALADAVKAMPVRYNCHWGLVELDDVTDMLADFCGTTNPRFNRERWLDYIAGKCGPNGGSVKP